MGKDWNPLTMIYVNSEKNLNPLQRNKLTSMKASPSNSKMLRTRLETMGKELLLWSSPSRRSSQTWASNDNWIISKLYSYANVFTSSSMISCCKFLDYSHVPTLLMHYFSPRTTVSMWASYCISWIPVFVDLDHHWTLPLMTEHFVLFRESPGVAQPLEAYFLAYY